MVDRWGGKMFFDGALKFYQPLLSLAAADSPTVYSPFIAVGFTASVPKSTVVLKRSVLTANISKRDSHCDVLSSSFLSAARCLFYFRYIICMACMTRAISKCSPIGMT
jgi:hypothetical protein